MSCSHQQKNINCGEVIKQYDKNIKAKMVFFLLCQEKLQNEHREKYHYQTPTYFCLMLKKLNFDETTFTSTDSISDLTQHTKIQHAMQLKEYSGLSKFGQKQLQWQLLQFGKFVYLLK